jgi:prepilin-type N-terminal cleavage/methylation domain-containing protein
MWQTYTEGSVTMYSLHLVSHARQESFFESRPRQRGFSLLEVFVAITVLSIGAMALMKMQTRAVASNAFGNQLTQATFLAQDKVEELHLLNECYLAVLAKPQISWSAEDQNLVTNYNNQLSDSQNNWIIDADSDGANDDFDWVNVQPDHTNSDGSGGVANPIDVSGASAPVGGYTRIWNVVDNVPVTKAKTVHVRVTWANGRQVNLHTVLSQ